MQVEANFILFYDCYAYEMDNLLFINCAANSSYISGWIWLNQFNCRMPDDITIITILKTADQKQNAFLAGHFG